MKTIGLIGGMSWESSVTYYRTINEHVARRLGGLHSAPCVLWSFDFSEIHRLQHEDRWDEATKRLSDAGVALRDAGADFLVICTNTMHKMADAVQAAAGLPLLHIADSTAERIQAAGLRHVGLLGTRFTMEEDFYRGRLAERHGLEVSIPSAAEREFLHSVIFGELCRGIVTDTSRRRCRAIIDKLTDGGCGGMILGCTELGLLITPGDSPVPLFDTAIIHAEAAAALAVGT
ncbi:MAG TPA: aspartate/glutamate racemase family protein [Phycisphaerae bacterium]|nr:aspartate/glutamate racemase family protein [Phycisphaerae bacterium]HNU45053.1 aspartate/glutamate racemase family protein [Phycisphaerae bacterium]